MPQRPHDPWHNLPATHQPIRVSWKLHANRAAQLDADTVAKLHARDVQVKEAFTLQDAEGHYFRASLKSLGGKGGEALVYEEMARSPESPVELTLVCAVLARQRMLLVVQKATELGVTRVIPVFSEYSVKPEGLEHEKAHAWPKAAVRAAKQCRRAVLPEVRETIPLAEALMDPAWTGAETRLYMDDRAPAAARMVRGPERVVLAVGPEGGWSEAEREQLQAAKAFPLALGGRVLRAETAVITGLVLMQHRLGDLTSG